MAAAFLTLEEVSVKLGGALLLDKLDWTIYAGEQWSITGPSGSGKTILAHALLGRHFSTGRITSIAPHRISIVEQQHRFKHRPGSTELYYQQRFNSSDADQTITVEQELIGSGWNNTIAGNGFPGNGFASPGASASNSGAVDKGIEAAADHWLDDLHIRPLLEKPLI